MHGTINLKKKILIYTSNTKGMNQLKNRRGDFYDRSCSVVSVGSSALSSASARILQKTQTELSALRKLIYYKCT